MPGYGRGMACRSLGRLLGACGAKDGHLGYGQRTLRSWIVYSLRETKGQAAGRQAVQALARGHPVLLAALAEGDVVTRSVALTLAGWTRAIPVEFRDEAEAILVEAARAGAGLRTLAALCAEIRSRVAAPDPGGGRDPGLDRGVFLDTTVGGAGIIRGDLTPGCAAKVQAVPDALPAPQGKGGRRTRPQRLHDALEEALTRLLASGLLPRRAGQPVKDLVHVRFAGLPDLDGGSVLQGKRIGGYRARWAAARAAAPAGPGDGGAWLGGGTARAIACDAMAVPAVTGDVDPDAVERLIGLCVDYHRVRARAAAGHDGGGHDAAGRDAPGGRTSLAGLKDCCWWHHHVLLHRRGWRLTARPGGTSEARSPAGRIIRSHGPPPRPG